MCFAFTSWSCVRVSYRRQPPLKLTAHFNISSILNWSHCFFCLPVLDELVKSIHMLCNVLKVGVLSFSVTLEVKSLFAHSERAQSFLKASMLNVLFPVLVCSTFLPYSPPLSVYFTTFNSLHDMSFYNPDIITSHLHFTGHVFFLCPYLK